MNEHTKRVEEFWVDALNQADAIHKQSRKARKRIDAMLKIIERDGAIEINQSDDMASTVANDFDSIRQCGGYGRKAMVDVKNQVELGRAYFCVDEHMNHCKVKQDGEDEEQVWQAWLKIRNAHDGKYGEPHEG